MALDRTKYIRTNDVLRRLGGRWNRDRLRRARDRFPGTKLHEGQWFYLRDVVDRVAAEEKGTRLSAGDVDAIACRMLLEGKTDGEVIMELRIPAEHVATLRVTLGLAPPAAPAAPRGPSVRKLAVAPPTIEAEPPARGDPFWETLIRESTARRKGHAR